MKPRRNEEAQAHIRLSSHRRKEKKRKEKKRKKDLIVFSGHRPCESDKSAVAQHALEIGHRVEFSNTCRSAKTKRYMDRIIKEAIEIKLHPDNINRDGDYILSRAWQPVLRQIGTSQRGLRTQQ
jgi:hypothetical protein